MSNGLNLLHPRKDVAEMVIVFCVSLIVPEDLMFAIKSGEHVYQESSFFVSPLSFLRVSWWYQVSMSWCNCSKMSEVLAGAHILIIYSYCNAIACYCAIECKTSYAEIPSVSPMTTILEFAQTRWTWIESCTRMTGITRRVVTYCSVFSCIMLCYAMPFDVQHLLLSTTASQPTDSQLTCNDIHNKTMTTHV